MVILNPSDALAMADPQVLTSVTEVERLSLKA